MEKQENMTDQTRKLINDEAFILWCLFPTSESDIHWKNWLQSNPGKEEEFNKAVAVVKSLGFNEYELSEKKQQEIFVRLRNSLENDKKKSRHVAFVRWAVASVAVLVIAFGVGLFTFTETKSDIAVMFNELKMSNEQTEIELILNNNQKILLSNNVKIKVDAQGQIYFDKKKTTEGIESITKTDKKLPAAFDNANILKVPKGKRSSLTLSDGTKISINENTTVCFPTAFDTDSRLVYLDGEAFFEVTHNPQSPFSVRTFDTDINVLGTTFNVNAYSTQKDKYVVLCEGSVEVDNRSNYKDVLVPGEMLLWNENQVDKSQVDVNDYTFWKNGAYAFERKTLNDLMVNLSRYYHVDFRCSSNLYDLNCSGKLILFDDIKVVMNTLAESFSFTYVIKNDVIYIQ